MYEWMNEDHHYPSSHPVLSPFSPSWDVYKDGIPQCLKADGLKSLPYDICFSFTKYAEMTYTATTGWDFYIYTPIEII